jgi:ankyrin repeat protein
MSLPSQNHPDDSLIAEFKPNYGQWQLHDDNIKRIDPNDGRTILHNYCKFINSTPLAVFKWLIETKGCDLNQQDKDGDTPLHFAFRYFGRNDRRDPGVLLYLLNYTGVNANIRGRSGLTLLNIACRSINQIPFDVVKCLVETLGSDVTIRDENGDTPIHDVIYEFDPHKGGDIAILIYLLNQENVNVNTKGEYDRSLLHTACEYINKLPIDVFKLLIETNGGDLAQKDRDGDAPIHFALRHFETSDGGDVATLSYLLNQNSVDINIKGRSRYFLFHEVCTQINRLPIDVFKVLITRGCDVNLLDMLDNTPVHIALRYFQPNNNNNNNNKNNNNQDNVTILTYLLGQESLDVNINGRLGYPLFHIVCEYINELPIDIFKVLIETKGCDVNAQDNRGNTPIHYALSRLKPSDGDITVFNYLFEQNVNLNITGQRGFDLLHLACSCDRPKSDGTVVGEGTNSKANAFLAQIVGIIIEKYLQQILDGAANL